MMNCDYVLINTGQCLVGIRGHKKWSSSKQKRHRQKGLSCYPIVDVNPYMYSWHISNKLLAIINPIMFSNPNDQIDSCRVKNGRHCYKKIRHKLLFDIGFIYIYKSVYELK